MASARAIRTIHIVRHGNTFAPGEQPLRIGCRTDIPLVESGRAQASALGACFRASHIRFDKAIVSPLLRTQETARLILAKAGDAATEVADWLAEIDHGPDEGLSDDAIIARIGAQALADWDARGIAPPGWNVDGEARHTAWRRLLVRPIPDEGERLLLVTSNGSARFAFGSDPALAKAAAGLPSMKLRTGAWGRIDVAAGRPSLVEWDRRP